jgi:hypothetical protein
MYHQKIDLPVAIQREAGGERNVPSDEAPGDFVLFKI